MQEESKRKDFKARSSQFLQDLQLTAQWLTKDRINSSYLIRITLNKACRIWHPRISEKNLKVLLFKILTDLFFNEAQPQSGFSPAFRSRNQSLVVSQNRFLQVKDELGINVPREIVRLPIEVRFAEILSTIGGFSGGEIARIIGVKESGVEPESLKGSRFLREQPFVFGEG